MTAGEVFDWLQAKGSWTATTGREVAKHFNVSNVAAWKLLALWTERNAWTREFVGGEWWYTVRKDSVRPVNREWGSNRVAHG